jgi:hypothetical protein
MSESKTLFSFFAGLLLGVSVFGVSIIGQGVWEAGRMWGEAICEGAEP